MVSPLNQPVAGYLATPLVEALQRRGLFRLLDTRRSRRPERLAQALEAHPGPLALALEALAVLGWLERDAAGAYRRTAACDLGRGFDLTALYAVDLRQSTDAPSALQALARRLDQVAARASRVATGWPLLAEGALTTLFALARRALGAPDFARCLAAGVPQPSEALARALRVAWDDELETAARYRTLLAAAPELLFGERQAALAGWRASAAVERELGHDWPVLPADWRASLARELDAPEAAREARVAPPPLPVASELALEVDDGAPVAHAAAYALAGQPAQYLDARGALVGAAPVLQAWARRCGAWADEAGGACLALLVAHATPLSARGRADDVAALVDVVRRLAHEHAITAEAFVALAASQGLFDRRAPRRRPASPDACVSSLHEFERRDYVVRQARLSDLGRLCALEELCWQHTRMPEERLRARLRDDPQAQFVLERAGQVLGVIYSQRIATTDALTGRTAADVHELRCPAGAVLQILALNVDPGAQNLGLGDQLLEFFLQWSAFVPGLERVVGVTLCKHSTADASRPFEEYIRLQGIDQDPVLAFHQSHGAEIVGVVAGYRPEDHANGGRGVLVAYDPSRRTPRRPESAAPAAAPGMPADAPERAPRADEWLRRQVAGLLRVSAAQVDMQRPLMEMGLDSADLLALQQRCEETYGRQLAAGFFFEHATCAKVAAFLSPEATGSAPAGVAEASDPRPQPALPAATPTPSVWRERDVAVVGMACRLPGDVSAPDQLWRALRDGRSLIGVYPRARGPWASPAAYPGIERGGFVSDAWAFDEAFFRMSPAEAQRTDPQQRLVLEATWACLEDAGILPATLQGTRTGVFVGASNCDYGRLIQEAGLDVEAHHGVGGALCVIANRVSYFFDWCGPSLLVDTACSSSLVALHEAVQALRSGECPTALVAGVNLLCHPDLSIAYHKAGMLSPDGLCKVFDARADGYVRSEGVVALLLKPLRQALADRDQIHAVIRGSASNHGGLAAGLTVPSAGRQSELLQAAWQDAELRADELGYVEAHGTGTALGDPIEVEGLLRAHAAAFGAAPARSCGIGSLKSNLGHLEAAAGLAGLLKVIVAMQRRQLPATLHFERPNPKLGLDGTPFHVQARLAPWDRPGALVAGVSSFGSGGANAHVVVQDYPQPASRSSSGELGLFVLSARDPQRLAESAARAVDWLEQAPDDALGDALHTWQVGRVAMKHRLAIPVRQRAELVVELRRWLAGRHDAAGVFCGASDAGALGRVWRSPSGRQVVDQALAARDLEQLAALWTAGAEVDWRALPEPGSGARARRCSLPTYPFARVRHWIEAGAQRPRSRCADALPAAHALVQRNTSDLSAQRYTSIFRADEPFVRARAGRDASRHVLPVAAHLEMARAAIEQACRERPRTACLELLDVCWLDPEVVADGRAVEIVLVAGADAQQPIEYEISGQDAAGETVHCTGRARFTDPAAPPRVDLVALSAACAASQADSTRVQLVTRLDPEREPGSDDWLVQPRVIDDVLAACLSLKPVASEAQAWPVSLASLRLIAPERPAAWAWIRRRGDAFDVDLCDADGQIGAQLTGLALATAGAGREASSDVRDGCLLAVPTWQASALAVAGAPATYVARHVVLCELPQASADDLSSRLSESRCLVLTAPPAATPAQRYAAHALACFEHVRDLLHDQPRGPLLLQLAVAAEGEGRLCAGLAGLLRTAALEHPQLACQVLLVPAELDAPQLAERLRDEQDYGRDVCVHLARDERRVARWQELAEGSAPPFEWADEGVYLITGGLGRLGLECARDILARTRQARVVLTGRAARDDSRWAERCEALARDGRLCYRQVDLERLQDVERLVAEVEAEQGALRGVLHCAGMLADSLIAKKSSALFSAVLAPKVTGTWHLDQATRDARLDFFALFSSVNSATGNVGQADYAAANGFLDEFAAYRDAQVAAGQRHGRTRVIDWPLWRSGGMGVDSATQALIEQTTGMRPLSAQRGLHAFRQALALPHERVLVAAGDLPRIAAHLQRAGLLARTTPAAALTQTSGQGAQVDEQDVLANLRELLAGVLRVSLAALDSDQAFVDLGVDSFLGTELIVALNKKYGTTLSNTRIYDYPTPRELAALLAQELRDLPARAPAPPAAPAAPAAPRLARDGARARRRPGLNGRASADDEPIAVVGMSGRYPGARDLQQYWSNLRAGRNSIVEMPAWRWDVAAHYHPDPARKDKTVSKWIGALDDVSCFDPLFFRISPQEAAYMDPQQRLFLQESYRAFEDAGYSAALLREVRCGVYLGLTTNEYAALLSRAGVLPPITSNNAAIAAGRIAYHLDLKGPALTVDTACSSSLVALHLACQALRAGEVDMALAGGVTLYLTPESYVAMSQVGMLSPSGQCRTFDDGADGIVNGEGVGTLVLKRLRDAQADGDVVHGVILGSGLNQDGRTNGITAPSVTSQSELTRGVYARYGIDPASISYVEAHGTGTPLGDPIELEALAAVFRERTSRQGFCGLGSVKSNIGHVTAAAGVAGVHKVLLSLRHRTLPATLNVTRETSRFDFATSPFYVCRTTRAWDVEPGARRIAGVSSFGFSGTNAHVVLAEHVAPVTTRAPRDRGRRVCVPLSARKSEQLREKAGDLLASVREQAATLDLEALAYTLQVGRDAMEQRLLLLVDSLDELTSKLERYVAGESAIEGLTQGRAKRAHVGDPAQSAAEAGTDESDPARLASLWASGRDVDWGRLYPHGRPARVSLPGYPFARERYWLAEARPTPPVAARPAGETWSESFRAHAALLVKVLWNQLRALGLLSQPALSVPRWKQAAGFRTAHERWLDETLTLLAERGHLSYDGELCRVSAAPSDDAAAVWSAWDAAREVWSQDANLAAPARLLETAVRALPEILTGRRAATEVLFPDGSLELVEGVYAHNAQADFFNALLADAVAARVADVVRRDPRARVRLIEVGAGTGGSTAALLPRLAAQREHVVEYCYTDVSRAFLLHGEERYAAAHACLSFRLFDVHEPPHVQGLDVGAYDVAIATNVLHATRDVRLALRHVKALLKPGGALFLNEMSESSLFTHLTFGLLEGWWLYDDRDLRLRGCPALAPETWRRTLEEQGLRAAFVAREAAVWGQQVLVAESDGVIGPMTEALPPAVVARTPRARGAAGGPESVQAYLAQAVAHMMKLAAEDVDLDTELGEFGFDSISLTALSRHLSQSLRLELTPAVFFEHPTLRGLAQHLVETCSEALARHFHWSDDESGAWRERPTPPPDAQAAPQASARSAGVERGPAPAPAPPARPAALEDVAIIGLSGCFPQAEDVEAFWDNLRAGRDCIREIPVERWDWSRIAGLTPEDARRPELRWAGLCDAIDEFDPLFFGIAPREAELMDPHQRLLMTQAWKAVEDAGYAPQSLSGSSTALLVGTMDSGYGEVVNRARAASRSDSATGAVPSIGPNRMSFLLDLHGPSEPIETACSSSLVAIHRGRELVASGQCELAIVGGVNALVNAEAHLSYGKAGMLSPDGRCKAFSARANGYVRGEGAGMLVLKQLRAAERDGDHVYAVLRGSAENHGGRANSLTAPNPKAQAALLCEAYARAGVDPRSVSYVEAHGTGTALGDPIEINGLASAFQEMYEQVGAPPPSVPHCGLGSVKSNVGHLELAAGVTGVIKVLLQLRHKTLVKTLHCDEINPYVQLEGSPFYLVRENREWSALRDEQGRALPRRAGVSSFGFGGVNAHVVLEEYVPAPRQAVPVSGPAIVLLSARNEERLREQAARLLAALASPELSDADLADVAYTLQVGREAMEQRLALLAGSLEEAQAKLRAFLAGETVIADFYRSDARRGRDLPALFKADDELHDALSRWVERGKLSKLLGLWVNGLDFDWRRLYAGVRPRRVSLPTYPFARERHWVQPADVAPLHGAVTAAVLHPLLQHNTSHLGGQRYSSTLTGREFFLADHRLRMAGGQPCAVLPGVAYLEMARAAVEQACLERPTGALLELSHVVWAQPLMVADSRRVDVLLASSDDDTIAYEICSSVQGEEIVYGQGRACWRHVPPPRPLDLEELRRLTASGAVSRERVYATFAGMGVVYGPTFRAVSALAQTSAHVLVRLSLPAAAPHASDEWVLHPSLMDGALQACIGLLVGWSERPATPRLPFALEQVRVFSGCEDEMLAWARYAPGSQAHDALVKLDVDLCALDGRVCVELRGLSTRPLRVEDGLAADTADTAAASACLMATPVWQASALAHTASADYAERHVLLCELEHVDAQALESSLPGSRCLALRADASATLAERYSAHALACFERLQGILQGKPQGRVLVQVVCADEAEGALFAGLSGLLKTAALENPQLAGQVLLVPRACTLDELAQRLRAEAQGQEPLVRYERGERRVLRWQEADVEGAPEPLALREDGVYLISGGLGGLGLVFAREILARASRARVVLLGRSLLDASRQARLEALAVDGRASYRQVDLARGAEVEQALAALLDEHGRLDGLLHAAGVLADSFIVKKTSAQFQQVLAPKVAGAFHLDEASRAARLDFFVLFSSLTSVLGNLGQADYAAANGFLDRFAAYRNAQVEAGLRHGRTRAIHWPLWQAGGMRLDAQTEQMLARTTGIRAMRSESGLRAFHRSLTLPADELLVAEGELRLMRRALLQIPSPAPVAPAPVAPPEPLAASQPEALATLREQTQDYLRRQLSSLLKLAPHRIDAQAALENYGIDSILAIKLTNQLEAQLGSLPKTLFFEYQTLAELSEYLLAQHAAALRALLSVGAPAAERPPAPLPVALDTARERLASVRRRPRAAAVSAATPPDGRVAIIGLSGRYPEAADVEQFWRNLRDGRDCIVEVPEQRWDWRAYYSADRTRPGRHYSKWGGFIEGVDEFDSLFFSISPKEAALLDPQERLFLEQAWQALEDAGYTRAGLQTASDGDLPAQVGVYAGVWTTEYQLFGAEASLSGEPVGVAGSIANVANRVSYHLNLHGPSLTVDTMCSASLTAIHLACEDLRRGRTNVALAGGVNVSIHPNKYLVLSALQAISTHGHCQAFGQGGDGYIPSEGVGVVVLKRLADAERDGDHVYGVIRGSALSHGGKTNGYTVPNPQAQASAISRALAEAGVDARHVSYVEAHGTGTRLGDPIEIAGLSRAFQRHTADTAFCRIGSAKSNIGHCESAAGIAGLTKVLLQLRQRQIAPSLHAAELNAHIDFDQTPFVVNRELRAWEQPELEGRLLPRLAGVSSFGAGGSNAHLIVEEYVTPARPASAVGPLAFVLSARTSAQLEARARDLLRFVRERQDSLDLAAVAYTLQVGREAMEERLGCVASDAQELIAKLEAYLAGAREGEDVYHGQGRRQRESLALFGSDADLQQVLRRWLDAGKLAKALELWTKGLDVDWLALYPQHRPRRVSLPTYPFARERHWLPQAALAPRAAQPLAAPAPEPAVLHPLLHRNTSDLAEQSYSARFSGHEPFLRDHVVRGQRLLPGVAQLEMVRAAVELAAGAGATLLTNVVWVQPVRSSATGVELRLALHPADDGALDYEISSAGEDGSGRVVHGQGRAWLASAADASPGVDVARVMDACKTHALERASCYAAFQAVGLEYGPTHQALERLLIGSTDEGPQALGRLRLPQPATGDEARYGLHPSMLDAALQATLGLLLRSDADGRPVLVEPWLPFLLERLAIHAPTPHSGWAWARWRPGTSGDTRTIDVDLCDDQGQVCVTLGGLHGRPLQARPDHEAPSGALAQPAAGTLLLAPVWEAMPLPAGDAWPADADVVAIVGGTRAQHDALRAHYPAARVAALDLDADVDALTQQLQALGLVEHLFWVVADARPDDVVDEALIAGQRQAVVFGFRLIKALLRLGYASRRLGLTVVTRQAQPVEARAVANVLHASVHGLIGSLAKEYPHWGVRLVDLDDEPAWPLAELLALPADPRGDAWAWRAGQWLRQQLVRCELPSAQRPVYRAGGVYVVIGGAGGVGEVFSEHLIRTHGARVTWIGRRERDAVISAKQERLSRFGPAPDYVRADAGDFAQLQQACAQIRQRHGAIHGVIHAALELLDRSLWQMDEERFSRALAAKVDTSVRLAQVFASAQLESVTFFSSLQSFGKAAGQSNYAAGCTFVDAFAHELRRHWTCPVKVVNWGYWGGVGVVAAQEYQERMAAVGLGSLEPGEGMRALEQLADSPLTQVMVLAITKPEALALLELRAGETLTLARDVAPPLLARLVEAEDEPAAPAALLEDKRRGADFEDLLARLLACQLDALGAFAGDDVVAWRRAIGLPDVYAPWLQESLRALEARGCIARRGAAWTVASPVDARAVWDEWALWKRDAARSSRSAQARLAETTLRALPDILRGRRQAPEVLFPDASLELVEGIYRDNPTADFFNEALAGLLARYVRAALERDPQARLRILEIGAGTGGSTASILKHLGAWRGGIAEYAFTDLSKAFLLRAEQRWGGEHAYLRCRSFDVERPLGAQDLEPASYDVVVAGNVLHATRSIRQTLRNAKAALKRGGLLLLNELAENTLFAHVTFGLTEGWWRFEDAALRLVGSPGLAPARWRDVLRQEGFEPVLFPVAQAVVLGQQILAAQSDGVLRQAQAEPTARRAPKPAEAPRPPAPAVATAPAARANLHDGLHVFLVESVSQLMQVRVDDVDLDTELSEFGFDSISFTGFSNHLNQALALELTPAVFFEHTTLRSLASFLAREHAASLEARFHAAAPAPVQAATPESAPQPAQVPAPSPAGAPRRFARWSGEAAPAPAEPLAAQPDAVAVIGVSGCFPQAEDVAAFWDNLLAGRDCVREVDTAPWAWRALCETPEARQRPDMRWAGLIDGLDEFDPLFFGISPGEAELMDPQQRLLMIQVWKAVEDAGYAPQSLSGSSTALLVGTVNSGYSELIAQRQATSGGDSITGMVPSIGPNRMSYLLNLHGPSEPIETACSSSLVAIHRGRELVASGQCELAIVGGVNALVSPEAHLGFSKAGMLSPDGRCKAFSAQANGYVRGEGAGMLVLKKLRAAERDGDHVYAVLRGSAENHGGRATSLTAPNPNAQAELIKRAYTQAGIDPRSVSYVEAHGTGTALGDPVEIAGLQKSFQEMYEQVGAPPPSVPHCGLGSVKSNVGHLELASGVAGVIKVLLQLRHKTLVKTLHCDEINPYVQLEGSPFYLVRENREWSALHDEQGRALPRRAGVSSFGFGGVNAHVVLEEYVPAPRQAAPAPGPVVVALSARTEQRLREQAARLLAALTSPELSDADLADVAYTLQVGREAMEQRLALLASSLEEAQAKLREFLAGRAPIEGFYRGELRHGKEALGAFKADDELQEAIAKWIERGKLSKLLSLWVKGLDFDWRRLHADRRPRRLSLPTYPFARERCWFDAGTQRRAPVASVAAPAALHPLLHANTSDLREQRYSSVFTGDEFFLADHRVRMDGERLERVLPGAAYLEMARAALERAWPARAEAAQLELRDVVWAQPVVVTQSQLVHVALRVADDEGVDYEIYSGAADEPLVHGQGRAFWRPQAAPARIDLDHLARQIGARQVSADDVYAAFARRGFAQGPSLRVISVVRQGGTQSLAWLRQAPGAAGASSGYVLHPSLMDGALQVCAGLLDGWSQDVDQPRVPFALDSLRVVSPCVPEMVAWARYTAGQAGGKLVRLDVELCDLDGRVCVQMRGLASRVLSSAERHDVTPPAARETAFDADFYRQLLTAMLKGDVSIDEAVELG